MPLSRKSRSDLAKILGSLAADCREAGHPDAAGALGLVGRMFREGREGAMAKLLRAHLRIEEDEAIDRAAPLPEELDAWRREQDGVSLKDGVIRP